jgi:hypothetical protein
VFVFRLDGHLQEYDTCFCFAFLQFSYLIFFYKLMNFEGLIQYLNSYVYFRFQLGLLYFKIFNLVPYVSSVCISWSFPLVLIFPPFSIGHVSKCQDVYMSVHVYKSSATCDKTDGKTKLKLLKQEIKLKPKIKT